MAQRLFRSIQDKAEDRHVARVQQALHQSRCRVCGRFTKSGSMVLHDLICPDCGMDYRPGIMRKVEQIRRWWDATRNAA